MTRLSLATLFAFATLADAAPRPVPPQEAAGKMTVPDGFKVTLFAGEPDVVQPIAFTFDDRGRMWVVECLIYPKWDTKAARGQGPRRDPRRHRRRRRLRQEDACSCATTGGTCPASNSASAASGSARRRTSSSSRDCNGEDKPAGPPEVLLDGLEHQGQAQRLQLADLGAGRLAVRLQRHPGEVVKVGKPGTPDKDRVTMDCGVWRYHPTKQEVRGRRATAPPTRGASTSTNTARCSSRTASSTTCGTSSPAAHYQRMYGQDVNPYIYEPDDEHAPTTSTGPAATGPTLARRQGGALRRRRRPRPQRLRDLPGGQLPAGVPQQRCSPATSTATG